VPDPPASTRIHAKSAFMLWYAIAGSCLTFVSAISLYREITRHSLGALVDRVARQYADILEVVFLPVSWLISLNDVERIATSIVAIFAAAFVRALRSLSQDSKQSEALLAMIHLGFYIALYGFILAIIMDGMGEGLVPILVLLLVAIAYIMLIVVISVLFSVFGPLKTIRVRFQRSFQIFSLIMLNIAAAIAAIFVALLLDA
jgi:hypothetical protein